MSRSHDEFIRIEKNEEKTKKLDTNNKKRHDEIRCDHVGTIRMQHNYIKYSMKRSKASMLVQKTPETIIKCWKNIKNTCTQIRVDATTELKQMFELNACCYHYQCCRNLLLSFSLSSSQWPLLYRRSYVFGHCTCVSLLLLLSSFCCFRRCFCAVASSSQMSVQFVTLFSPYKAEWVQLKGYYCCRTCSFLSWRIIIKCNDKIRAARNCCWYEFAIIKPNPSYRSQKQISLCKWWPFNRNT